MRYSIYMFQLLVMILGLCFFNICYCGRKFKTSVDRIRLAGFKSEVHKVTTLDGYVLTLFRIVTSSNNKPEVQRQHPVLILHGLFVSSDAFLLDSDGLGFVLARDNWDVWLGNVRGNYYSRQHNKLSPNGTEFWDYSWHEMGQKDISAMIDYILSNTGKTRLNYIGHSMGNIMFYVMASTMPSYNKKINTMVSLAPAGRFTKWISLLNNTTFIYHYLHDMLLKSLQRNTVELFPRNNMKGMSKHQVLIEDLELPMRIPFEVISWFSKEFFGDEIIPDGTSLRTLLHFTQIIGSGTFKKYDYGSREMNMKTWGSESPPSYNISKIEAPVAVYYSVTDEFNSPEDAEYLIASLPNVVLKMRIDSLRFSHVDFCITTFKENRILRRKMHDSIMDLFKQRDDDNMAKTPIKRRKITTK